MASRCCSFVNKGCCTRYFVCELWFFAKQQLSNFHPRHQLPASEQSGSWRTTVSGLSTSTTSGLCTMLQFILKHSVQCVVVTCQTNIRMYKSPQPLCTNCCKGSGVEIFHYHLPNSVWQPDASWIESSLSVQSLHSQLILSHDIRCLIHVPNRIPWATCLFAAMKLVQRVHDVIESSYLQLWSHLFKFISSCLI